MRFDVQKILRWPALVGGMITIFPYAIRRGQIRIPIPNRYTLHIYTFIYIKHGYNELKVKTTLYPFVRAVRSFQANAFAADSYI